MDTIRLSATDGKESQVNGHGPDPRERGPGSTARPGTARRDTADALLERAADGDHEAFASLYDLVAPDVHGIARAVLRDDHHAQDVTQDVLLEAWRTATRYDPERGSARAWLTTMAHRRAVDHVRSLQAASNRDVAVGARSVVPDHDAVIDEVETHLQHEQVRRCLGGLTEIQRSAVMLAFYRGLTHREISDVLAVRLGTVKARLRDALIRLRDCLGAW